MYIIFTTKRDVNGNRYYLTVNPIEKTFSRIDRWYDSNFITVSKRDKNRIIEFLKKNGYTENNF